MNKKIIIIGLIVGVSGYLYVTGKPFIQTEEIDYLNKTAKIVIGNKEVNYKHDGMIVEVGKVSILYSATIKPLENGFQVNIVNSKNEVKFQQNYYFGPVIK